VRNLCGVGRKGHGGPDEEVETYLNSFFNFCARCWWVFKTTPWPLHHRDGDPAPMRLSRPQDQSGRVRKISPSPAFDPQTFHPVAIWFGNMISKTIYSSEVCSVQLFKLQRFATTYTPCFNITRNIKFYPHPSISALESTQPPVQWVTFYFPGVNRPWRGVEHPPSAEVKKNIPSGSSWTFLWLTLLLITIYLNFTRNIYLYLYVRRNSQNGQRFFPPKLHYLFSLCDECA